MDSDLLSQLLFKANKAGNLVKLYPVSNNEVDYYVIDPSKKWEIQSDSLINDFEIIDLNNIISASIIDKKDFERYMERDNRIEYIRS